MLIIGLSIDWNQDLWGFYGDPYDYLHQAKFSIFSSEFYFPKATPGFYPRPFVVPFFYQLFKGDFDSIIVFQIILHSVSALMIGFALIKTIKNVLLRIVAILFWYLLSMWWNVMGWDVLILSESITASLLFMWIASGIYLLYSRHWFYVTLHIIITIFFALSRDHWPVVILLFYLSIAIVVFIWNRKDFRFYLTMFGLSLILMIFQQKSADAGNRHYLPVLNNIGMRIAKDPNQLEWFKEQGMPKAEIVSTIYHDLWDNSPLIMPFYNDTNLVELHNWVKEEGKQTYVKFLITHPLETFLFNESNEDRQKIFAYNTFFTNQHDLKMTGLSELLFPLFNLNTALICILFLIVVFIMNRKAIYQYMLLLLIPIWLHIIISYNADAVEVERHLILTNILVQFIGIYSIVLVLDSDYLKSLIHRIKSKTVTKTD